jgi:hypothetical protein
MGPSDNTNEARQALKILPTMPIECPHSPAEKRGTGE